MLPLGSQINNPNLIFVADAADIVRGEFVVMGIFFRSEVWSSSCYLHHVKLDMICCEIYFDTIYAVLSQNLFCTNLRTFQGIDKFSQNSCPWRKNYKYKVCDKFDKWRHLTIKFALTAN